MAKCLVQWSNFAPLQGKLCQEDVPQTFCYSFKLWSHAHFKLTHRGPPADGSRTPDLAKLFLDLSALYLNVILMLSRLGDERMLIPWLMIQLGDVVSRGEDLEAILQFLCDPHLAKRPLIVAYLGRD